MNTMMISNHPSSNPSETGENGPFILYELISYQQSRTNQEKTRRIRRDVTIFDLHFECIF